MVRSTFAVSLVACVAALVGCMAPSPPPTPLGLTDIAERPAEKALLQGMRAYDDAQYAQAEQSLGEALRIGLASPRDRATAHKLRAFIDCTSARMQACADEFQAARDADPNFTLSRAEAGHPQWGPVWRNNRGR